KVYAGADTNASPLETLSTPASGSSWSVDASPALPAGTYTVLAQQTSVAGTGTSSTAVFRVDTTAPAVSLRDPADGSATNDQVPTFDGTAGTATGDGGTATVNLYSGTDPTGMQEASFRFVSSEAASSFECRLDGGPWGACSSPKTYTALAAGSHTFDVRAIDAAGNADSTPDTHTWTIDTTLPPISLDGPE